MSVDHVHAESPISDGGIESQSIRFRLLRERFFCFALVAPLCVLVLVLKYAR